MTVKEIVKALTQQGWRVERTKKNHWRCVAPCGRAHFMPGTPSDWRSTKNTIAALRRMGATL